MPIDKDVQNLRAENSSENDGNSKVPRVLRLNALPGRIPNADPETYKNSKGDEDSVGWDAEAADLKQSWEH